MECLQALRKCCMENRIPKVNPHDTSVVLDERGVQWPLDTKTAWMNKSKEFYTLHALLLLLEYSDKPIKDYIREATTMMVKFVSNVDRKELLAYLRGEIDTADAIKSNPTLATKSPFDTHGDSLINKRQRMGEGQATRLSIDQLRDMKQRHAERLERPTRGRTSIPADKVKLEKSELLDGMSSDKVLELRAKRLAQKRSISIVEASGEIADENDSIDPAFLKADREIVAFIRSNEIFPINRKKKLQCENGNFKFVIDMLHEVKKDEKDASRTKDDLIDDATPSIRARARTSSSKSEPPPGPPIIIVPSLTSALITLRNAKEYFEEGKFEPGSGGSRKPGEPKPQEVLVHRKLLKKTVVYRLVDNPAKLRPREWDNVVCVLVQGNLWQFKGWKWDQPVHLFQNTIGIHFKYDDERLEKVVSQWNVQVIEMNKYRRHSDKVSSFGFWRMLDDFMIIKKPALYKNLMSGS